MNDSLLDLKGFRISFDTWIISGMNGVCHDEVHLEVSQSVILLPRR